MDSERKTQMALDLAAQACSILPPIKGCWAAPAQAMKGGLRILVAPVQQHEDDQCEVEKLSFASVSEAGSSPSLDELLDNTFPIGQSKSSAEVEDGKTCEDSTDSLFLTVPPIVIKEMAEGVAKELESSFNVGFPVYVLYKHLIDDMIEELELLTGIKVTCQVLGGRLFPDKNSVVSRVVREACESLSGASWMNGTSSVDSWTIWCIAHAILRAFVNCAEERFQPRISSPDTDAVERTSLGLRLSEVQVDLLRICEADSERHSRTNVSETKIENPVPRNRSARSCDLEDAEELEIPVCPNGTTTAQKPRLLSHVSKFLRRVLCFGCIPVRRVTPL
ncbi:hypothetical protein SRHO_G00126150 [Serrasalmus rhombeus]